MPKHPNIKYGIINDPNNLDVKEFEEKLEGNEQFSDSEEDISLGEDNDEDESLGKRFEYTMEVTSSSYGIEKKWFILYPD